MDVKQLNNEYTQGPGYWEGENENQELDISAEILGTIDTNKLEAPADVQIIAPIDVQIIAPIEEHEVDISATDVIAPIEEHEVDIYAENAIAPMKEQQVDISADVIVQAALEGHEVDSLDSVRTPIDDVESQAQEVTNKKPEKQKQSCMGWIKTRSLVGFWLPACVIIALSFGLLTCIVFLTKNSKGENVQANNNTTTPTPPTVPVTFFRYRFADTNYDDCCGTEDLKSSYLDACTQLFKDKGENDVKCFEVTRGSAIIHTMSAHKDHEQLLTGVFTSNAHIKANGKEHSLLSGYLYTSSKENEEAQQREQKMKNVKEENKDLKDEIQALKDEKEKLEEQLKGETTMLTAAEIKKVLNLTQNETKEVENIGKINKYLAESKMFNDRDEEIEKMVSVKEVYGKSCGDMVHLILKHIDQLNFTILEKALKEELTLDDIDILASHKLFQNDVANFKYASVASAKNNGNIRSNLEWLIKFWHIHNGKDKNKLQQLSFNEFVTKVANGELLQ